MNVFSQLNLLAVLVAGVAYFVLGALWYSPLLFAKPFMKFRGATREQLEGGNPLDYGLTLINALIVSLVLAIVIRLAGATSVIDGLAVGVLMAAGFAVTTSLTFTIFAGPHKGLWLIYSGYKLAGFAIMGIILAVWR